MRNRTTTALFFGFICLFIGLQVNAQVELPSIFGSNMVIQRNNDVSIWGSGPARSEIVVTTSWNGSTYTTKTDKEGNWILKVKTTNAGGPYQVDISNGGETVSLENVMIGEVWVCSGQSNMERPLKGAGNDPVIGANEAILRSENPNIRFFKVENEKSSEPKTDFSGEWELCSRKTAPDFSATGYFFGNLVQEIIDVPVGLIASDWGATRIQFWMDEGSLNQFDPEDHKNSATTLFNGMIHPMLGFNIRGVVWYQGESNRYNPGIYKDMMVEMVKGWRAKWGIGEFPFYYCQIAPYKYTNELNTALLREAQLMASKEIPNSGMACLLDAGDENYIHPSKKRIAGERLAYLALKNTYGVSGIHAEGPEFVEMKIDSSSVELTFDKKLTSFGRDLKLFELAGEDKKFYPAKAVIHKNTVIVTSEDVLKPIAARYGFKNFVDGDLFDRYGIPASSFRTDDW